MYCFSAYDFFDKYLIDCNTLALNIECISELLILIMFEVDIPYILITHACPNFLPQKYFMVLISLGSLQ